MVFCVKDAGKDWIEVRHQRIFGPQNPSCCVGQSKRIAVCRESVQAFEASIEEVNMKAHELALVRDITDKQAVLNIAFAKEVVIKLQLAACPDI